MAMNPQLQQLLEEAGLDTGITDPREEVKRDLADLGIGVEKQDEGWDVFQPVRTFFGAAGNIGGQLLGLADPEAYEQASKEVLGDLGYGADSPWYERAEAAPGLGDVAAQMVPDEVRESLLGRAVGPAGRMIGNILGDPTTYTPFVLSKLGGTIARAVPTAAPLMKTAALAKQERAQKVAAGLLSKTAAAAKDWDEAQEIAQVVMREGSAMQRMGFQTAEGLARGGDMAMGAAAALAYGPQVVNAAWEGAKRIPEAEGLAEGVVEGVNTTLMAGLSALMGKGLIDATTAARTVAAARSGKALDATKELITEAEQRTLVAAQEVTAPGDVTLPPGERPVVRAPEGQLGPEDLELLDLETARRRLEEGGMPEYEGPVTEVVPEYEGPVEVVQEPRAEMVPEYEGPVTEVLPEAEIVTDEGVPRTVDTIDAEITQLESALYDGKIDPTNQEAAVGRLRQLYAERVEVAREEPGVLPKVEPIPEVEPELPMVEGAEIIPEPEVPVSETPVVSGEELPGGLEPYAQFVEGNDLRAGLAARGMTIEEFAALGHDQRMATLAGVETPTVAEPAPAPEPVEPVVTPEVPVSEIAPEGPSEALRGVEPEEGVPPVTEPVPEPEAPPAEAPTEPTPQQAEDTPTPAEPALGEDVEQSPFQKASRAAEDEFADEGNTLHKAMRSIIEGRKSRGETAPADFPLAAEALNVLEDPGLRRKLLDSTVDVDGNRVKIRDLPPGKIYPAVERWIRNNRMKKGGAGAGARGGAGAVEAAGAEAGAGGLATAGAPEAPGKKKIGKKAQVGTYEKTNEILKRAGLNYKQFAGELKDEWTGALGTDKNKAMFDAYIELREGGMGRSDAIKSLFGSNSDRFSSAQSVRNVIASYEKKLNQKAEAKFKDVLQKELDAEDADQGTIDQPADSPTATTPEVVDVAALSNRWGALKQRIPVRPADMDAATFANQLKGKKGEIQTLLEDYYRFAGDRSQKQGLGAAMPDKQIKAMAENLGINIPKGANVKWVIRKIGETVAGIDPNSGHWKQIADSQAVRRAAQQATEAARSEAFDLPGWKGDAEKTGPNGSKVTVQDKGATILFDKAKGGAEAKLDILDMLENPQIKHVMIHEDVKGLGPLMDELPLVLDEKWMDAHPDATATRYIVDRGQTRVEPMETRDLANPYNPQEGVDLPIYRGMDDIRALMRGEHDLWVKGQADEVEASAVTPEFFEKEVNAQLKKAGLSVLEPEVQAGSPNFGEFIGAGQYHETYRLRGPMDGQGRNVVMRIGFMPWMPHVTAPQKALMAPVHGHGKLVDRAAGTTQPLFYSLHPEGSRFEGEGANLISGEYDRVGKLYQKLREMGVTPEEGTGRSQYANTAAHDALWAQLKHEMALPDGVTLQNYFDDHAELFARAQQADMYVKDMGGNGSMRTDQTIYVPLGDSEKVPANTLVRETPRGRYALYFADAGVALPNEFSRLGTPWEGLKARQAIALKVAEHTDDAHIPLPQSIKRHAHYREDDIMGLDIGEDMKVANHDRRATDEYVRRMAELGSGVSGALREVTTHIVKQINDEMTRLKMPGHNFFHAQYRGLTASPHLGGVYLDALGDWGPAIYTNPVEQVRRAGSRTEAIDDMLYALFHEITHDKSTGHGDSFRDIEQYIKGLRQIQDSMDIYRTRLEGVLTEDVYRAMRDELVPQFNEMRKRYGRPSWREEAVAVIPTRDVEVRTKGRSYRRGRGAQAAEGDLGRGVRPGEDVPRGGTRETGGVRPTALARRLAASRRGQGEGFGHGGRGGYAETVRRIEELTAKDSKFDAEKAKELLHEFMQGAGKTMEPPVRYSAAWDVATRVVNNMTPDEVKEYLKGRKPGARGKDAQGRLKDAVWNLSAFEDLSDNLKARMLHWGEFTKGERKRDKVRTWAEVDEEVKELLGLDTPEGWALAFRKKGGGLRDSEVLLLREVHNELAGRVRDAETRFTEAMAAGDADAVATTWDNVKKQSGAYFGVANKAADLLTEAGRALAIARKSVRRMDPQLAFEQDLMAGIRDRVKRQYRDPVEAEKHTKKLFKAFMDARDTKLADGTIDPESWGEFYRAYRTIIKTGKVEKAIEFYKAGLLGYSSRVANLFSNSLFRGVRYVEDSAAAALDMVGSKLTGREREIFAGEVGVSALAMRRAFVEAVPQWVKANKDAFMLRPEDAHHALTKGGILEDMLQHPGAIEGKKGEFIRFAFKGLSADDQLAKHISAMDHMYRTLYRRFRKGELKTKKGETFTLATERTFGELRQNYEDALAGLPFDQKKFGYYEKIFKDANEVARADTFQKELGNMGRGVQSVLRAQPWAQIFIPFLRTPWNIAAETVKRTPLGLIEVAQKWGKEYDTPAKQMSALSRPIVGTAIGGGILSMAMNGEVTGGGPLDPEDQEALRASGWQPYSFKIGNQYVSFQRMEPIAAIFGIAADAAEGLRNGDFDKWQTGAMRVVQSAAENITNKTFLAGLDGVTSAISHPNMFMGRFVKQMQGSMIPNSLGFMPVGHLARAVDPVFRDADPGTVDVWSRKIPWLSRTVEPQYGPTGEERQRGGTAAERLISPFARWAMREGPEALGAEEIVRLGAAPSAPKKSMYSKGGVKVELEPEERQMLAMSMREATKVIGQRILKDPNYLKLPDDEMDPRWRYGGRTKKDVLKRVFQRYRSRVTKRLRREVERRGRAQYRERQKEAGTLGLG